MFIIYVFILIFPKLLMIPEIITMNQISACIACKGFA